MTKKKKDIRIVQVGYQNWTQDYQIPDHVEWVYVNPESVSFFVTEYKEQMAAFEEEQRYLQSLAEEGETNLPKPRIKPPTRYSGLLLTGKTLPETVMDLESMFGVYTIFYEAGLAETSPHLSDFLYRKMAQLLDCQNPPLVIEQLSKALFSGQYGARLEVTDLQVSPQFTGSISYKGKRRLLLEGRYGNDYQQIAYFTSSLPFYTTSTQDIFFDHLCGDGVETKIVVRLIQEGSVSRIVKTWEFASNGSPQEYNLNFSSNGYLSISLFAKGVGQLQLGPCHYRFSRLGLGEFVLGGGRFVDAQQDEFMYYFDPQDFKPPFCVYFSGWRAAEGFEGYGMMKAMKCPFMLICDPRLSGGSFYLGSEEFEKKVSDVIQEKLDFLGFDRSQLVLSGLSMGTFGATYHGARLSPHTIMIGKPVFSLGEVAMKEKIVRPGGFRTSLDLMRVFSDQYNQQGAEQLDERFWRRFRSADFSQTKFVVCYMQDEDYDGTAFQKIIDHTQEQGAKQVILKGIPGRHNDNFGAQLQWFLRQYYNLLKNDFGREY